MIWIDENMKKMLSFKVNVKAIIIITLIMVTSFQGCKEECGCETEPYEIVTNVEAIYHYVGILSFLENLGTTYTLCNKDIVPDEIQLKADNAWKDELGSINVIVSGELHKGCKVKMSFYQDPGITLTDIKLSISQ
jgi:hypothetical protein